MSEATPVQAHLKDPPVSRGLVVFLAILLLVQLRTDRAASAGADPWEGRRGLRVVHALREYIRTHVPDPPPDRALYIGALQGMLRSLPERYNAYIPPRAARVLDRQMNGEPRGGIGVQVRPSEPGGLDVCVVLSDLPAGRAGVREGDRIVAVDGVDITHMDMRDSIELLVGAVNTRVEIALVRDGNRRAVTVERAPLPRLPPCRFLPGHTDLGYACVPLFAYGVEAHLADGVKRLQARGLRGLLIDLRWNPGGALETGMAASDLFLRHGTIAIVEERDPYGPPNAVARRVRQARADWLGGFPVVILVNGETASAAELFAAALRDNDRAVLVGRQTHGKARIQLFLALGEEAGAVNLTTGRYLTPKGADIQGQGLTPDIAVGLEDETAGRIRQLWAEVHYGSRSFAELLSQDPQLERAVAALREAVDSE